jgi:hypothetical protein
MTRWFRHLIYSLTLAVARLWPRQRVQMYRLTVLKLDNLGDAVLALGAVRVLLKEYGESETLLIVSSVAEPLFRAEFPRTDLMVLPPFCQRYCPDLIAFLWRHAAGLRSISTESLICLRHQPSDYLHLIARLIAPQKCYALHWAKDWENVSLTFPSASTAPYPEDSGGQCLELEANRLIVSLALKRQVSMHATLPVISSVAIVDGADLLVCPVAGTPIRQYPPDLLAAAIRSAIGTTPLKIAFCLPPGANTEPWRRAMDDAGLRETSWRQPTSQSGLLELIACARVILAVDSAPAHLATALDKPGVFLLGGGHFGMFAPWQTSHRQIWLRHAMECYHCRWQCIHPEPYCITHIQPEVVAQALSEVCSRTEPPR